MIGRFTALTMKPRKPRRRQGRMAKGIPAPKKKRVSHTSAQVRAPLPVVRPPLARRVLSWVIAGAVLIAAPFVVLIRGAVWLYADHGFSPWIALAVAVS